MIATDARAECLDLIRRWLIQNPEDMVLHTDEANRWLPDGDRTPDYCTAPIESASDEEFIELRDHFDPDILIVCGPTVWWLPISLAARLRRLARQGGVDGLVDYRIGDVQCFGAAMRRDVVGDGLAPEGDGGGNHDTFTACMERWACSETAAK